MIDITTLSWTSLLLGLLIIQNTSSQTCPSDACWGAQFNSSVNVVRLGIIANIHRAQENGQQCSKIVKRNVEMAEAVRWVFAQLNARAFIPGVTLDTVVLDACTRDDVGIYELVSLFPNVRFPSCQQVVHGVIGLTSSSQSISMAEGLGKMNVPLVSPTSSTPSLSNRTDYPTFFRTVPSAIDEVKALLNIVKELSMQYIAVVYSDDAYGRETVQEFKLAARGSVCIGGKFLVTDQDVIFKLIRLQQNLDSTLENLPVVYVGTYEGAELLVMSANSDILRGIGQRFLWIFGSSIGVNSDIFTGRTQIGRNVISLSPYSAEVQEFTDYWSEALTRVVQSNFTNSQQMYYREYMYDLLSCSSYATCQRVTNSINQNYTQTAFFNMALDAAYIYANAFQEMHSSLCNGQPGLCNVMQQRLQANDYLTNTISNSRFTFDDNTFSFLPVSLKNNPRTIQFYGNELAPQSPSFVIQTTRCDQTSKRCSFLPVGNVTGDNQLQNLEKQQIQFYLTPSTNEATSADLLNPIYCKKNCEVCESNVPQELPFASIWGEFLIVGFFSATQAGSDAFGCSDEILRSESVDLLEAMLYAVDVFNGAYNYSSELWSSRPSVSGKLGIIVFNDCSNPLYAGQLLSNWLTKKIQLRDSAGRLYDPDKCVGVIGGSYSSINLRLLPITKAENLLQVSATATSVQLEFNGSFLRTIPADDIQVQVMIDFVKHLGSNAVSIVYRDDSYGINGYEELKRRAYEAEICISVAIKIPVNIQENDVHDVLDQLRLGRPTRIVILFTGWREALTLLKVANSRASKKEFVWIGTESWGTRQNMLSDDTDLEALGSFTVLVPTEASTHFGGYLSQLRPNNNTRNPFFRSWWENIFSCNLPSKNSPNPPNQCSSSFSLRNHQEDLYADLIRKAIWSIGLGLSTTVNSLCRSPQQFCPELKTQQGLDMLVKNVKKVEMKVFGEMRKLYTERGDGNVDEDILNIQEKLSNKLYKPVARFHRTNGLDITANYTFYDDQRRPVTVPYSTCTECNCIFKLKNDPLIHLSKYIRKQGDMFVAAVLPVHSSPSSYEISMNGIVSLEALLSAVEMSNAKMRHKLGLIVYDGYGNRDLTDWHIVSLVNSGRYLGLEQYNINDSMIVAFLTDSDQDSLVTRKTMTSKEMIHFDMGKSLFAVSNEGSYYFSLGYTVQAELEAIVAFLVHHKWSNVQLLCSTSADSVAVCQLIEEMLNDHKICVIKKQTVEKSTYQTSADNVMVDNVVVALIEQTDVAPFIDALGATYIRNPMKYPVFIGWSRFTYGVSQLSGTYKDVCNNSVGFQETLQSLSTRGKQVLQAIKTVSEDPERNPWLTKDIANVLHTQDLTSHYRAIEDTVVAANILATALQDLLSAECSNQEGLCEELLRRPDWRNRLLKNIEDQYRQAWQEKTVFDIVTYVTDDVPNAPYRIKKIGEYDAKRNRTRLSSKYILRNISSNCENIQCDVCDFNGTKGSFPVWGIAFLVVVPLLLIVLAILLAINIRDIIKRRRENEETYLSPEKVPARQHFMPPPLPSRESQERMSHGVTSMYSPGASDASASSFVSASSNGDNRFSASTFGSPRQSSSTAYQPDGSARGPPHFGLYPPRVNNNRNGSYLNPGFADVAENDPYSMSLSSFPTEENEDKPISYGQLKFENTELNERRGSKSQSIQSAPTVHASGPIADTYPTGLVSSV